MKIAEKVLKVLEASPYIDIISKFLNSKRLTDIDPRWVEAYLRLKYDTLDHLSKEEIQAEIPGIAKTILSVGKGAAENLAKSYGL